MTEQEPIRSSHNPLIRRIRKLQTNARFRKKDGAFVAEGVAIVLTAISRQAGIETIVFCGELLTDREGQAVVADQRLRGVPCIEASESVFRTISERNNPDGLIAVCKTTWRNLSELTMSPSDVFVALVRVSDPGNLGTILRTMDAVQAAGLILVGESTHPFHPRTVRASRGTIFTVPLCYSDDMNAVFDWAIAHQVQTVATSARARCSFWDANYQSPLLCIFGNEHTGLDDDVKGRADQQVSIPVTGATSSLNLPVAAGLFLYERLRRMRRGEVESST